MTTYGDFSSLLQLGVGIGIGLSLFRAPVDLRVARLEKTIDGELNALKGATEIFGKGKRRDLLDLRLRFVFCRSQIEESLKPYMGAAILGSLMNLILLFAATVNKERLVEHADLVILTSVSIGWYFALMLALELFARSRLGGIKEDLIRIQLRTAKHDLS